MDYENNRFRDLAKIRSEHGDGNGEYRIMEELAKTMRTTDLEELLKDHEPCVRVCAARFLLEMNPNHSKADETLKNIAQDRTVDPVIRLDAKLALKICKDKHDR